MDGESEVAAARAYVADLRSGRPPPRSQPEPAAVDGASAQPEPAAWAFADGGDLALAEQPLELLPAAAGLDLVDRTGADVFGRLADLTVGAATALTAAEVCRFAIERTRNSWTIVARSACDGSALAAYHPGWRPAGGDVWVTPGHWCVLRWTPLALDPTWRLIDADREILRLRSVAVDRHEMVTGDFPARHALLLLFVCWVVMAEVDTACYFNG